MEQNEKVTPYFCSYYKKDIISFEVCEGCVQPHLGGRGSVQCKKCRGKVLLNPSGGEYISCRHIRLKQNYSVNTVLPKDFFLTNYLKDKKSVLISRTGGGIGDLLMITPTLRALKENYPQLKIVFQTSPQLEPLLRYNPHIDEVIDLREKRSMDARIDLSNPCPCIGYELDNIPNVDKGRIELFARGAGIALSNKDLTYIVTSQEQRQARRTLKNWGIASRCYKVGFGLKSSEPKRDWELEKYTQLAELVKKKFKGKVFAFHSKKTPFSAPNAFYLYSQPIREVAALISLMDVFVGSDTGLIHLAAAVGTPVVGIFGPIDPQCRLSTYKNAVWVDKVAEVCPFERCWYSFPCKEVPGTCIKAVKPEDVFEKIVEIK